MTRRRSGPWAIISDGRKVGVFATRQDARDFLADVLMGEGYIIKD